MKRFCNSGWACMYGARICPCFRRYPVNVVSLAHLPLTRTTGKSIPLSRYSRVPPILSECPVMGALFASTSAFRIRVRKMAFDMGLVFPFQWCSNRWLFSLRLLIFRWFRMASSGSAPVCGCAAQFNSSPWDFEALVHGMWMVVTLLPCRSVTFWSKFDRFTWILGSKASNLGMVNSPSLATDQNDVVRHAKTAASKGSLRSRFRWMAVRSSTVHGGFCAFSDFCG